MSLGWKAAGLERVHKDKHVLKCFADEAPGASQESIPGWDGMGGPLGWERSVCWHGSIFQHDFLLQGLVKDSVSVSLQPGFPAVLCKSWFLFESINNEWHKVPKVKRPCSPPLWRSMGLLLDLHDLTAFMVWSCCCFCSGISKSNLKCSSLEVVPELL